MKRMTGPWLHLWNEFNSKEEYKFLLKQEFGPAVECWTRARTLSNCREQLTVYISWWISSRSFHRWTTFLNIIVSIQIQGLVKKRTGMKREENRHAIPSLYYLEHEPDVCFTMNSRARYPFCYMDKKMSEEKSSRIQSLVKMSLQTRTWWLQIGKAQEKVLWNNYKKRCLSHRTDMR